MTTLEIVLVVLLIIEGWFAFTLLNYSTQLRLKLKHMGVNTKDWRKWRL